MEVDGVGDGNGWPCGRKLARCAYAAGPLVAVGGGLMNRPQRELSQSIRDLRTQLTALDNEFGSDAPPYSEPGSDGLAS
jgi:hypothetical protein